MSDPDSRPLTPEDILGGKVRQLHRLHNDFDGSIQVKRGRKGFLVLSIAGVGDVLLPETFVDPLIAALQNPRATQSGDRTDGDPTSTVT